MDIDMTYVIAPIIYRLAKTESMLKTFIQFSIPEDKMDDFKEKYFENLEKTAKDVDDMQKYIINYLNEMREKNKDF